MSETLRLAGDRGLALLQALGLHALILLALSWQWEWRNNPPPRIGELEAIFVDAVDWPEPAQPVAEPQVERFSVPVEPTPTPVESRSEPPPAAPEPAPAEPEPVMRESALRPAQRAEIRSNPAMEELARVREQRERVEAERREREQRLREALEPPAVQSPSPTTQTASQTPQTAQPAQVQGKEASLLAEYRSRIRRLVTQNWRRPLNSVAGQTCNVRVRQIPGGEVISAAIVGRCDMDSSTQRSVVDAVQRAAPLPYRGYEDVFARQITFEFVVPETR